MTIPSLTLLPATSATPSVSQQNTEQRNVNTTVCFAIQPQFLEQPGDFSIFDFNQQDFGESLRVGLGLRRFAASTAQWLPMSDCTNPLGLPQASELSKTNC
ncbi:MAG: hypothetical protein ACHBN1_09945 [Heteroscytonema crispum UTEX LB 1556]